MKIMIALAAFVSLSLAAIPSAQAGCGMCEGDAHADKAHHKMHKMDIVDLAAHDSQFSTLVTALKKADLVTTLQGKGPFTVFAPTNEAFAKLPKGELENLLKPENKKKLASILTYHVVPKKVTAEDVRKLRKGNVATVQGKMLKVNATKNNVRINKAKVVKTDLEATNGVVHVIDTVMIP